MRKYKRLALTIDGVVLHTSPIQLPENGDDCKCPSCFSTTWIERYSIVQHAFDWDDCLDIIECDNCHNVYHVQYDVLYEKAE